MKKLFNLFSPLLMVCIIFAFNCAGDDEPVDKKPMQPPVDKKPMQPVDKPMQPVDKPMQPVDKPMQPVDKPMQPVDKPMSLGPKITTICENPDLTFPDCLPPLPVCDDPATIDAALPGTGTTGDPFVLCRPAHLRLIGDTVTDSDYTLEASYILGKDIALPDNGSSPIGGPCGMPNAFMGSFNGKGKTISNIGFTSAAKNIYVKNLFACSDNVTNTNYSYALSDEEVCLEIDNDELVTREDNNSTGPYIVCSNAHLNAIDADEPGFLTDSYALYQNIALADNGSSSIGEPCGEENAFTGSFDGKGKTISNIGFTSALKDIYVKNLFSCSDEVKNTNYSYALSDEDVCVQVDETMLVTREDNNSVGPYIVCSRAHLNAVSSSIKDSYAFISGY